MQKKIWFLLILISLMLAGCTQEKPGLEFKPLASDTPDTTRTLSTPPVYTSLEPSSTQTPDLAQLTPDVSIAMTAMAWFNNANMAFTLEGKGLNLAYSDSNQIWNLTKDDVSFLWSPDGKYLAYADNTHKITVLNTETGNQAKIQQQGRFAWHPGSHFMAVASFENLYLVNAEDGSLIAQLKLDSAGWTGSVSFAPDGKQLAFLCNMLYIVNLEMNTSNQPSGFGEYNEISSKAYQWGIENIIRVEWSPAGDRLAVTVDNYPDYPYIAIISPEGILRATVDFPDMWEQEFSWSPNGEYLAVRAEATGVYSRIYIVNNRGGGVVRVAESPGLGCVGWTPDGNYLIFSKSDWQTPAVLVRSDLAGIQKLTILISSVSKNNLDVICAQPRPGRDFNIIAIPSPTPDPRCTTWSQLKVGISAKVIDTSPNRVRSEPQKGDNLIGSLAPQSMVKVLEGPICSDGLVFWKVESNSIPGGWGWTAEGDGITYWMAPYTP